jgi:uncharacterized membrane protein HdeD (DUF308 family)
MLVEELHAARQRWWLFLLLGAVLVLVGLFALSAPAFFTDLVVIYFGCLFLVEGVFQVISAFATRIGGGFFIHLLVGALDAVVGLLLLARPGAGALVLTLLLAVSFLVGGLVRAGLAVGLQHPGWGLAVLSGLLGVVLGVIILIDWQESRVWVLGLLVGIDLTFRGFSWVFTALALRRLPETFSGTT